MPKPVKPERLDRHPGDGLPLNQNEKRGGAGKYSWGTVGDESGPAALDKNDPNYVDEDEENAAQQAAQPEETTTGASEERP